jgi:hypothetical protein
MVRSFSSSVLEGQVWIESVSLSKFEVAFLFLPRSFVSSAQVTSTLSRYVSIWPWFILGSLGGDQFDVTSLVGG